MLEPNAIMTIPVTIAILSIRKSPILRSADEIRSSTYTISAIYSIAFYLILGQYQEFIYTFIKYYSTDLT